MKLKLTEKMNLVASITAIAETKPAGAAGRRAAPRQQFVFIVGDGAHNVQIDAAEASALIAMKAAGATD